MVHSSWLIAISYQLSAISYQPSAISHQLSAISHQPSARCTCLEIQIILSLEFVSDFAFRISYFTIKYFAKKSGVGLIRLNAKVAPFQNFPSRNCLPYPWFEFLKIYPVPFQAYNPYNI